MVKKQKHSSSAPRSATVNSPTNERGARPDNYHLSKTTHNKPQLALQSKCPMSLLNSGSKISRPGLGTQHVLEAGTLCLAHQWGGNTSILDKVCFSGSNLLMPLSALRSWRGSVTHQAVKKLSLDSR